MTLQELAFRAIERERARQERVHPNFDHTEAERLAILTEEVGEVAQAVVDHTWDPNKVGLQKQQIYRELVQTAAVCVRWIEALEEEQMQ